MTSFSEMCFFFSSAFCTFSPVDDDIPSGQFAHWCFDKPKIRPKDFILDCAEHWHCVAKLCKVFLHWTQHIISAEKNAKIWLDQARCSRVVWWVNSTLGRIFWLHHIYFWNTLHGRNSSLINGLSLPSCIACVFTADEMDLKKILWQKVKLPHGKFLLNLVIDPWMWTCFGDYRTIWHQDNLAPRTIWHRGQFGTGQFGTADNLAPRTIWHHGQFGTAM